MMKAWLDLKTVAMPLHMKGLARDERGYPVPYNVAVGIDGKPAFKVQDVLKVSRCIHERRCAMCGKRIAGKVAFVGGPLSIANRLFTDPGMHADCATYALQVCPMLAAPRWGYARHTPQIPGMVPNMVDEQVSTERPERYGLGLCDGYELADVRGQTYIHAAPFESVQWWKNGQLLDEHPQGNQKSP